MKQLKGISSLVLILALVLAAVPAKAADSATLSFTNCTTNNPDDVQTGIDQMSVLVEPDPLGVSFTFYNIGADASSITDVYFDDGTLLAIATITDSGDGVSFSQDANPGDLPGGNNCQPPFEATQGFTADSDPPAQPMGVNPGEWVKIVFTLQSGQTFDDVVAQLASGALRIGIHVQGFAGGGSESFVNTPPTAITLASLAAKSKGGSVALSWTTGTEIDNAGFNIYRAASADGARARLNSKLLGAQGDAVSGGSYSFTDASGYGTFYYWLEDVSYTGKSTLHGPVLAVVTSPFRSPLYRPASPFGK